MGLVPGWLLSVPTTTFLYVTSAQHIAGCVVVESIKEACAAVAPEAERSEVRQQSWAPGFVLVGKATRR